MTVKPLHNSRTAEIRALADSVDARMDTTPVANPAAPAAPPDMTLQEVLADLGNVSDAHITAGQTAIQTRRDELAAKRERGERLTGDERTELGTLADSYGRLTAQLDTRTQAAAADDAAFGAIPSSAPAAAAPAAGNQAPGEAAAPGGDGTATAPVTEPSTNPGTAPAGTPVPSPAGDGGAPAPVAASAVPRLPLGAIAPHAGQPGAPTPSPATPATIVAGAGSQQARDSEIDRDQLVRDLQYAIGANEFGGHGKVVVASIRAPREDRRHLSDSRSADANSAVIEREARAETQALVAAGGFGPTGGGAPFQVYYDVDVIGSSLRPCKASLPQFTADRGGLQFRRDIDAFGGTAIQASGTWTNAMDADPDNSTPKPIWDVPLLGVESAQLRAVTRGVRLSNLSARFDPEATAAALRTVDITHARYAELLLLGDMYSGITASFAHTINPNLGIVRNLLEFWDKTAAYLRENHRLDDAPRLQVWLPRWVREAMRTDMVRAMHTSNAEWLALTNAAIDLWFTNRGIDPVWLLDGRGAQGSTGSSGTLIPATPAQSYTRVTGGSSAVPPFPTHLEFLMAVRGTYFYMDGGDLDVGIIRDQQLVQKNRYVMFSETFEGAYRKGVEAIRGVIPVNLRGGSAGAIDPSSLAN